MTGLTVVRSTFTIEALELSQPLNILFKNLAFPVLIYMRKTLFSCRLLKIKCPDCHHYCEWMSCYHCLKVVSP